jgi:hypothetical protein
MARANLARAASVFRGSGKHLNIEPGSANQRVGVEIVQVEKHSAFCASAELVEERFFRVILTRVTKIRDVVFRAGTGN